MVWEDVEEDEEELLEPADYDARHSYYRWLSWGFLGYLLALVVVLVLLMIVWWVAFNAS